MNHTEKFIKEALLIAFNMGQVYWQQADSDCPEQLKRGLKTVEKYEALVNFVLSSPSITGNPIRTLTNLEMLELYCEPNTDEEMMEFGREVQRVFMEKNGLVFKNKAEV